MIQLRASELRINKENGAWGEWGGRNKHHHWLPKFHPTPFLEEPGDRFAGPHPTAGAPDSSDPALVVFVGAPNGSRDGGMNSSSLRGGKLRWERLGGNKHDATSSKQTIAAESCLHASGEKKWVQCSYIYNNKKAKRTEPKNKSAISKRKIHINELLQHKNI